jgi:hypothetical protein
VPALVSVRTENVPGSNWVCRSCRRREPRGSERTTTLERERAGTSMFFGNLGASAEARPEVPHVPGSESSKGHLQSLERSVTRTTSMGESGPRAVVRALVQTSSNRTLLQATQALPRAEPYIGSAIPCSPGPCSPGLAPPNVLI